MNSIHILTLRNPRLSLNSSQPFTKIVISKSHKSRLGLIVRMMREEQFRDPSRAARLAHGSISESAGDALDSPRGVRVAVLFRI